MILALISFCLKASALTSDKFVLRKLPNISFVVEQHWCERLLPILLFMFCRSRQWCLHSIAMEWVNHSHVSTYSCKPVDKIPDIFLHFPAGMLWILERPSNRVWQRVFWRGTFWPSPFENETFPSKIYLNPDTFDIDRISKSISFN